VVNEYANLEQAKLEDVKMLEKLFYKMYLVSIDFPSSKGPQVG
jgi:hypothetical protein